MGFNKGEEIRNDMVVPKGTLAFKNPTVIGIVEHAQKGVIAPSPAAMKFPKIPFVDKYLCIFFSGICIVIYSTIAVIEIKSIINSIEIIKKYRRVSNKVFIFPGFYIGRRKQVYKRHIFQEIILNLLKECSHL